MNQFDISWASLWRIFLFVALVAALYIARDILVIVFLAIILSAGLDLPVTALEKKKVPRLLSTLFIFLAILLALGSALYALIPLTTTDLQQFLGQLSRLHLPAFGPVDFSVFARTLNQDIKNLSSVLIAGSESIFSFIAAVFGNFILVVATLALTFYLTIDRDGVENFLRAILPLSQEDQALTIYRRVRRRFGLWLEGQVVLMIIIATLVFLGLYFLGVPYAFVIAVLAGILEIIPFVGPIFTGIIAFLVGLSVSLSLGFYALLFFAVVQQLESQLFVPIVMRRTVGVNPVIVVVAILLGVELAGLVGVLVAVPAVVIFEEILDEWGQEKSRRRGYRLGV